MKLPCKPIDIAVALDLYGFNVSAYERAKALYDHFNGCCAEMDELVRKVDYYPATELAPPTALVYVEHALARYGVEAQQRNEINYDPRPIEEILADPKYRRTNDGE